MSQARHLLRDIDTMVTARNPAECGRLFQRLANLYQDFSLKADQDQLAVFDDVFVRLLPGCDHDTLLNQTQSWAKSVYAPKQTLIRLALHSSLEFSIPVLVHSRTFDGEDLLHIARQANEAQQLVLATRAHLPELASDYLMAFASAEVRAVLAANPTAQFSKAGLQLLDDARSNHAGRSVPSLASLVLQTRFAMVAGAQTDNGAEQSLESRIAELIMQQNWSELLAVLALGTDLSGGAMVRAMLGPDIRPLLQLARAMDWAWPVVKSLLDVRTRWGEPVGDLAEIQQDFHDIEYQQARMCHEFLVRRSRQTGD
jgi:hypothetical protein